jgi:hypothetical protein
MSLTHFGVTDWVKSRLAGVRQLLKGPEVRGVNIVNIHFFENGSQCRPCGSWYRLMNAFEYKLVYDIKSLIDRDPVENTKDLLRIAATLCVAAPWPQVRAIGTVLQNPIDEEDERSLKRCLTEWEMAVENMKRGSNVGLLN